MGEDHDNNVCHNIFTFQFIFSCNSMKIHKDLYQMEFPDACWPELTGPLLFDSIIYFENIYNLGKYNNIIWHIFNIESK